MTDALPYDVLRSVRLDPDGSDFYQPTPYDHYATGLVVPRPGDLAAELARTHRTVLVTPPTQPYERVAVEHRDLTDPPTPPPDWA